MENLLNNSRILITGGAGFIGSHLAEKLFSHYNQSRFILYDKITYIKMVGKKK